MKSVGVGVAGSGCIDDFGKGKVCPADCFRVIVLDNELNLGGSPLMASHQEFVVTWPLSLQGVQFGVIGPAGTGKINRFNTQQSVVGVRFKNFGIALFN